MKTKFIVKALLACSLIPSLSNAATVSTDPVGAMIVDLKGGDRFSLVSLSFLEPPILITDIVSIEGSFPLTTVDGSGARLTLSTPPPECDSSSGLCYYIELLDGPMSGSFITVSHTSENQIEIVDDVSQNLSTGSRISLRTLPTIASVLGADNKFGLTGSADGPDTADEVYVFNPTNQITSRYYYSTFEGDPAFQGWLNSTDFSSADDVILYPDSGLIFRIRGENLSLTFTGDVRIDPINHFIHPGFNVMPVMNPLADDGNIPSSNLLTLGNSNLFDSNDPSKSITPYDGSNTLEDSDADLIYVMNADTGVVSRYFYSTLDNLVGWFNYSDFSPSNDVILNGSSAFYIRRMSANSSEWIQPINHFEVN